MQQCSETFSDVDTPKIDSLSKKMQQFAFLIKSSHLQWQTESDLLWYASMFRFVAVCEVWLIFFLDEIYVLFWSVLKSKHKVLNKIT